MKVLAILSQKGGVGKTTLATCLAVAAEQAGKVAAIIDLEPQATASFWKDVRQLDTPAVASIQPVRLPAMLKARSEEHTPELQSLMRISYAVLCLKKKTTIDILPYNVP